MERHFHFFSCMNFNQRTAIISNGVNALARIRFIQHTAYYIFKAMNDEQFIRFHFSTIIRVDIRVALEIHKSFTDLHDMKRLR